jgi:hypothetical protein
MLQGLQLPLCLGVGKRPLDPRPLRLHDLLVRLLRFFLLAGLFERARQQQRVERVVRVRLLEVLYAAAYSPFSSFTYPAR